jgi:hypothetical protein
MVKNGGTWEKSYFERAIQTSIGRALKTLYGVPQELPGDLSELLRQIDKHDSDLPADGGGKGNGHSAPPN